MLAKPPNHEPYYFSGYNSGVHGNISQIISGNPLKNKTSAVILLVYSIGLLLSAAITFKPGASFFYYKLPLQADGFTQDVGLSYRYKVNLPPWLFPPERVLLLEDGQQLERITPSDSSQAGRGRFSTRNSETGGFYVYLYPSEQDNPVDGDRSFVLYSALSFISPTTGIILSSLLLFGAIRFGGFLRSHLSRSQLHSGVNLFQLTEAYFHKIKSSRSSFSSQAYSILRPSSFSGSKLILLTLGGGYSLSFMEWLFQATKSSFMDGMSLFQKVEIFLVAGLGLSVAFALAALILFLIGLSLSVFRPTWLFTAIAVMIPAALFTATIILATDHFTYTLFRFGILTATGPQRGAWGIAILITFYSVYLQLFNVSSG